MGFLRTCGCCVATLVAFTAVFLGALVGGHLKALAPALSAICPGGNCQAAGVLPSTLGETPWRFEYSQLPDLSGKVALVTGANSGIGFWTALHLARKGAEVHLGCRSAAKCQKAIDAIKANTSSAKLEAAIGDISKLKSVRELAGSFLKAQSRLDILVLNAGIAATADKVTEDGIEPIFATNHVGHQLLYMLLEDLLVRTSEASGDVRVVAVSSASNFDSYPDGVALTRQDLNARHAPVLDGGQALSYPQSKLANILFAQEAALRMKHKNIYINSNHPGMVATEIITNAKAVLDKVPAMNTMTKKLLFGLVDRIKPALWTSEDGALTQVYLAAADDVRERNVRGRYFHPQATEVLPNSKHCSNFTLQKALWKFTEALIDGKDQ